MNNKKLVIIGGGEHACVVLEAAQLSGWQIAGYTDVLPSKQFENRPEVKYLGSDKEIQSLSSDEKNMFVLGIGEISLRTKILKSIELPDERWAVVIHPTVIKSSNVKIEAGSVVLAGANLGTGSILKKHSLVNTNSLVEHDCIIGEVSHLAPGVILGGGVKVGDYCLIGIGTKVRDHISIGEKSVTGTGSVVVSDVPDSTTVVGIPALPLKKAEESSNISDLCVDIGTSLHDAMEIITKTGQMIALVVKDEILKGLFTDGDLRKALLNNAGMDEAVSKYMCTDFIAVHENISKSSAFEIMKAHGVRHLPVTDSSGRLLDLHCLSGVVGEPPEVDVIIMAGGKGTRLLPLTENIPKPMVRVAGKPILEHIILHLISSRLKTFNLAVNHLHEKISEYFMSGENFGCEINYLLEENTLGTGGALKLLKQKIKRPVLAMNGDLITQVNIEKMLKVHQSSGNLLTVGVRDYKVSIPYGVIQTEGQEIKSIIEKPDKHYLINAGIYLINSELISDIPDNVDYPITNLIDHCLKNSLKVGVYLVEGDWVDIGQHNDLKKARGL